MIAPTNLLKERPFSSVPSRTSNPLASTVLSTHQLVVHNKLSLDAPHVLPQTHRLLKKARFHSVFQEADRVHLLQIFSRFIASFTLEEAKTLIEWYKVIKEELGDEIFAYLSNPKSYSKSSLSEVVKLLQNLTELSNSLDELSPLLSQFYEQNISLQNLLLKVEAYKHAIEEKKYPEKNLEEVIKDFGTSGSGTLVSVPLSKEQLKKIKAEYEQIFGMGTELKKVGNHHLIAVIQKLKAQAISSSLSAQYKLMLLAVAREAIKINFGIYPYNTQILTVLGLLCFPTSFKGRIAQVRTGEGKSTIVTLLAFYYACQGLTVDIVSSSRYLAQRDQEKYAEFFNLFDITTSHLCTDDPTEDNFRGQIIYGTNYDFEFALMRDQLGQENIRRIKKDGKLIPRPLNVVIVDEVDNLFIDSALDSARISIPGRTEMNWIYQPILDYVKDKKENLFYFLSSPENKKRLLQSLQDILMNYQGGKFKAVVEKIKLKKLENWMRSAYCAYFEKERDKDYVIKPIEVRTAQGRVYQDKVVIVDRKNTGRLKEKSRWQGGIHEFIEVKEHLPVEEENLMPASYCHPIYFNQYDMIFGTSGTMGTLGDKQEIQEQYHVDTFDVPPHKKIDANI